MRQILSDKWLTILNEIKTIFVFRLGSFETRQEQIFYDVILLGPDAQRSRSQYSKILLVLVIPIFASQMISMALEQTVSSRISKQIYVFTIY